MTPPGAGSRLTAHPETSRMPRARLLQQVLASAVALSFCIIAAHAAQTKAPAERRQRLQPEVSPAAANLLAVLNAAPEPKLRNTPGLNGGTVDKIMAHRKGGGKFANLVELKHVTGISYADLETLLAPFQQAEDQKALEASRKPVPDPPAPGAATPGGSPAGGAAEGPIGAVRAGFYAKLPGFEDLDSIDPLKKREFLETVNREMCTCGCKDETVAFCLVNDPGCPVVKQRARKIYDDIVNRPPR